MVSTKTNVIVGLFVLGLAYFAKNYYFKTKLPSPIVETKHGKVQGIVELSRNGREYYSYLGIPYAKPPVGDLRFEPPEPLDKPWKGVRDASSYGDFCLQVELTRKIGGNENCLFVNVFKPKSPKNSANLLLPVMVFFYGGAFVAGASNRYNPKYFMDEDVVFVTLNYRVSSFGFLNTGDKVVRGNMGLKDQVLALKWAQQNIANFGGDPGRVTIFGNSAGGASVHFHVVSPLSKGLFHRAISQSGTAISHWATFKKPREQAQRLAKLLNCPTGDSREMVACLKKVEPMALVQVHTEVMAPLRDWITLFVPTVEIFPDESSFLPAEPLELLKKGIINKVPWISGANSHEGLFFAAALFRNDSMLQRLRNDFQEVTHRLLDISSVTESQKLTQLKKFYLDKKDGLSEIDKYTNLFSDRTFTIPSHQSAELQAQHSPVYLYYYAFQRDISLANYLFALKGNYPAVLEIVYDMISRWAKKNILGVDVQKFGVCHADELGIFFPVMWDSEIAQDSKDYQMSVDVIKLWVAFAYDLPLKVHDVHWHPIDPKKSIKYLKLDKISSLVDTPFQKRIDFWNSFSNIERIHEPKY